MMDYIHLSTTTPCGESCAQVGSDHYMRNARIEAHAYIDQINRTFGQYPTGTRFSIVQCPHDFGTYIDIKFYYDDEDQRHVAYMSLVENGCEAWDDVAISQLKEDGYNLDNQLDEINPKREFSGDAWEGCTTIDNGPSGHGDECLSDADPGL